MEEVFTCCVGLDVHKESIEACVRRIELNGRLHQETRHWGSMTEDLLAMADWMTAQGVTHVAMESTGVFWKPIFNILEDRFTVLLVNAHHIKQVPGRQERRSGLPVDRTTLATRAAQRQLHSTSLPA